MFAVSFINESTFLPSGLHEQDERGRSSRWHEGKRQDGLWKHPSDLWLAQRVCLQSSSVNKPYKFWVFKVVVMLSDWLNHLLFGPQFFPGRAWKVFRGSWQAGSFIHQTGEKTVHQVLLLNFKRGRFTFFLTFSSGFVQIPGAETPHVHRVLPEQT